MTAEEFMKRHADLACEGKIAEIMGDLTPDALGQAGTLMAGAPQPFLGNSVSRVASSGGDEVFDVTYTADGGASFSMRETVRQVNGEWKIVNLERPS